MLLTLLCGALGEARGQAVRPELIPRGRPVAPPDQAGPPRPPKLPAEFTPWWQGHLVRPLHEQSRPMVMNLDNAVLGTLLHSSQVKVLSELPMIRRTAVAEAQSRFDTRNFATFNGVNTSDPVGSTLTTGGASRFMDQNLNSAAGVRRRGTTGAQLEASQRIGYQNNNSIFFVPNNQGTGRLNLTLTQPLMNGRGQAYNNSSIVLAEIDVNIAREQLSKDLQGLLLEVHRNYWDLYLQRAALLQKRKLQYGAAAILNELNGRREVDVLGSQIIRARAAVATRDAATIRFESSVRNAESRLRAIINDPDLSVEQINELIPVQAPAQDYRQPDLKAALLTSLHHRPEIRQAAKEMQAAGVRCEVSKNELQPALNLVLGAYASGLQGSSNILGAMADQFTMGRPTYSGGFTYDMAYGNRAALARMQRSRLEMRMAGNQLQSVLVTVRSEVEIAVREVETTYREMVSRYQAMAANESEISYLLDRWRLLPGDQQVAGAVLDDVLNAQERLAGAEFDFATAQTAYNIALINLERMTGTLLDHEEINQIETSINSLPTLVLDKPDAPTPAAAAPQIPPQPGPAIAPAFGSPVPRPAERETRAVPVQRLPATR